MNHPTNDQTRLVSVIVPVYNGEQFLAEAIESVLAQSYPSYELIVVDDGSTDRTPEIARSYPLIRYVYQTHRGSASARNRGILTARGEFLAFLDADDLWMPHKLSLQMMAFEIDPNLEIVTGYVEQFVDPEFEPPTAQRYTFPNAPIPGYSPIAILIRRSLIDKVGLFDESYKSAEVISWFVEAHEKKLQILILPDLVARRRIHGNNLSIMNREVRNKDTMQVLKNFMDRKRARKTNHGH
jgi:glycosyltransferase involved in cell wall biosynthesis